MRGDIGAVVTGSIVDDDRGIPLAQLCRVCGLPADAVMALVEGGILDPEGTRPGRWIFPAGSIRRARTAKRLQRDLEINLAGAALALELLDRIELIQTRLKRTESGPFRRR